jgi:hypothetical protein
MSKLSRDLATPAGGLPTINPREIIFLAGLLAAANAEIIIPADGASWFTADIRGVYVGTLAAEGSADGVNWNSIPIRQLNVAGLNYAITLPSAAQGTFIGRTYGMRLIRLRMTAWTSGSAACQLMQSTGPIDDSMHSLVTPNIVTAVGAAAAAVTLTLPAPGAGLRQYLTYLSINRFATALLTAAAAPVSVTTTNLPGSLAFSFAADAAAQGTIDRWREDFAYPLAASAQNTAVTVVAPVTTGVIWRLTGGYYIAP